MGAREPSVAVEACYPSLALDGGRDASRVFARSSCLPLESARGSGGAEGRRCRVRSCKDAGPGRAGKRLGRSA